MKIVFNSEEKEFLRNNAKGILASDLTEIFNKKFKRNINVEQIRAFKKNHRISSGVDCKFKKNKNHPLYVPIGSERVFRNYNQKEILVKNEYNEWEPKQKYLYRRYIGEIPKGYTILFLDNNIENFSLDNLALIPIKVKSTMGLCKLRYGDKELNKISILIAELKILRQEKKRSLRNERKRLCEN